MCYEPEKLGLPSDAKVLLFNDGAVKGRCATARRILGEPGGSEDDYETFKKLFAESGVDCFILNTGAFMDKDVTKEVTLDALETMIENKGGFKSLSIDGLEFMPVEGYIPDFSDAEYKKQFIARMNDRVEFIKSKDTVRGGYDKLPAEALESMKKIAEAAKNL